DTEVERAIMQDAGQLPDVEIVALIGVLDQRHGLAEGTGLLKQPGNGGEQITRDLLPRRTPGEGRQAVEIRPHRAARGAVGRGDDPGQLRYAERLLAVRVAAPPLLVQREVRVPPHPRGPFRTMRNEAWRAPAGTHEAGTGSNGEPLSRR